MRTPAFVLALGLAAAFSPLSAQGTPPAQESTTAPQKPEPLAFAWPVPCSVVITKDGAKARGSAKLRYRLDLSKGENGELRARQHDFSFLEVNGMDATTEAMQKALAPALALTQAVPDIVVDAQGRFLRIDGLDEMIGRVTTHLATTKGMSDAERARLEASMRAPAARATLEQACGTDWQLWVGSWIGCDLASGTEATSEGTTTILAAEVTGKVVMRNHGDVPEHPGHVRLSVTKLVEGEAATAQLVKLLNGLKGEGGKAPLDPELLEDVRAELVGEVIVERATLRPLRATRTKAIKIKVRGEKVREENERATFEFDWTVKER